MRRAVLITSLPGVTVALTIGRIPRDTNQAILSLDQAGCGWLTLILVANVNLLTLRSQT